MGIINIKYIFVFLLLSTKWTECSEVESVSDNGMVSDESSLGSDRKVESAEQVKNKALQFEWDYGGYIIFCLCMGRFGNQAEHFLGGLAFAKALNRTLVLPPWRTYRNVRFTEWFKLEPLQSYHKVVVAEDFMEYLAPSGWPDGKRTGWCWKPPGTSDNDCGMKEGNPFGPFWDGLGVDFDSSYVYHTSYQEISKWKEMYPASRFPVIALKGAPATFPMNPDHWSLQRYLQWSDKINQMADKYISENFPGERFVGLHLRNGKDWEYACKDIEDTQKYMASPQCLHGTDKKVTKRLCFPPLEEILRLTKNAVVSAKATVVYVATDKQPYTKEIEEHLQSRKVKVYHADPWLPQLDLAILIRSNYFVGNCVSSFTSFAKRARDMEGKPTLFWGYS